MANNQALTEAQVTQLDSGMPDMNTARIPMVRVRTPSARLFCIMPSANGTPLGDGLNTGSYTFSRPIPSLWNTSIVKIDYALAEASHFRGAAIFKGHHKRSRKSPGQGADLLDIENSKGIAGGTWP